MSNIYIHEPPTSGKVLLKTTVGDIDIELWSKETPKACRNFIQLCMEGYYNGTVFHRVVKNFIVQGGDPTGTGEGGESIYGKPFKDEFHQRLKFHRRGLLAMANTGPYDNGSQFFFTLGRAEHLQNKHTIFGKVVGTTLFNMLKLAEVETDGDERPLEPHKIKSAQILSNPFDDIVPRALPKKDDKKDSKKITSKSKATKNFSLLSFGEEAEEDEEETSELIRDRRTKSKSAHDLINDPKLSTVPAVQTGDGTSANKRPRDESLSEDDDVKEVSDDKYDDEMRETIRKKLKKNDESKKEEKKPQDDEEKSLSRSEQLKKESRQLKREMLEAKKLKEKKEEVKVSDEEDEPVEEENDALAEFHKEKKKYAEIKNKQTKGGTREQETLAMLAKFQSRLQTVRESTEEREEGEEDKPEEKPADDDEDEENDVPIDTLMKHRLQFESHAKKVKDANVQDEDTFTIHDPRNPINQRRREDSKNKRKGQSRR